MGREYEMVDLSNLDYKTGNVRYLTSGNYEEDILQVDYPHQFVLDLGWYDGIFIIYIIKDYNWSVPIIKYTVLNEDNLIEVLNEAIERITIETENAKDYYGGLWETEEYLFD